jgi:SAM-dependent methyltransferase
MNQLENWFCATNFWRRVTQQRLLPWMLDGADLGSSVLELGAGPGAATPELARRFSRVTSLEYSAAFARRILQASRNNLSVEAPGKSTEKQSRGTVSVAGHAENAVGRATEGENCVTRVVQGDAAQLPFADESFSCAVAILMLHHLRSRELQDCALTEIRRVLRPGGIFLALEIHDGWLQRLIHMRSTFVPVNASAAPARWTAAGLSRVSVDFLRGAFLLRAQRGAD